MLGFVINTLGVLTPHSHSIKISSVLLHLVSFMLDEINDKYESFIFTLYGSVLKNLRLVSIQPIKRHSEDAAREEEKSEQTK